MSTSVVLPALGESVTEGTVTRWLKQVGDTIQEDEGLLEISTDKVDTEIPSPVSGVIEEILVQEDETVEVGAVLAKIGDGDGAPSSVPDDAAPCICVVSAWIAFAPSDHHPATQSVKDFCSPPPLLLASSAGEVPCCSYAATHAATAEGEAAEGATAGACCCC